MNAESKINIHYSSLVGLKAELLRKQTEVQAAKAKQENIKPINKVKTKDKTFDEKPKEKKSKEKQNFNENDTENAKALQKSKLMLQAKSRLYDKLAKSHTNMNPNFLVDFKHKPDNLDDFEEECNKVNDNDKSDCDSDSGWVEYTDCFGRTRKCLQEDLPKMQEQDQSISKKINNKSRDDTNHPLYIVDTMPNKEPEIEMMRKKWEEQTEKLSNKANIHYEDVLFDEARTHGVGYYAFSQDEEERARQQENLFKLRKETEQKQKENQEIRNMKDKLQQNRLRVARMRQRIRAGLPIDGDEVEIDKTQSATLIESTDNTENNVEVKTENQSEQSEESIISAPNSETINKCTQNDQNNDCEESNKQDMAKNKLTDIENKIEAFGQLLGKRNRWYVMSQEEWVHKKRKDRIQEFGPVYENFEAGGSTNLNKATNNENMDVDAIISNNSSTSDDSDTVGPMPFFVNNLNTKLESLENDQITTTEPVLVPSDESNTFTTSKIQNEIIPQDKNSDTNIISQVEAGLKYLRQQFEKKHT